jgi:hypothetical protein
MLPLIVCIKVGSAYGPEYVNRLHAMVTRHTTRPHEFLCLTDDALGVTCPTAPIDTDLPGWWAKLVLFKPHWALKDRRVVFLDLDTIIVGNVDFLLDYQGPLAILRDFYYPRGWGSAVMSIAPGYGQEVWTQFREVPNVAGDQDWIQYCLRYSEKWQDLAPYQLVSYKVHCQPVVPKEAAIVCFHGVPKPADLPINDPLRKVWEADDRCAVTR